MRHEPPSIHLHAHETITGPQLRQVLLGIEEEGVPVEVRSLPQLNPLILAHQAATSSQLGIGLGISLEFAVITTEALPESRPYAAVKFNAGPEQDRIIGSNTARIVKRMPLRRFTGERTP